MPPLEEAIAGCLLGTAIGDAIGLPAEGLSRRRQHRMFPSLDGPRFLGARGMVSDDTEHACMVAEALARSAGDAALFRDRMASALKRWLLTAPAAVGFATLRASIRLVAGVSPDCSGVYSAGNGPSMRSALLGVCFADHVERLRQHVQASTRLTHTDRKAEWAAHAVAIAAACALRQIHDPEFVQQQFATALGPAASEFLALTNSVVASVRRGDQTTQFADAIGLARGVSGYSYHTVPVALHAWLRHPLDYRATVLAAVRCGGDADTTGAIAGAIAGAGVGLQGLPQHWIRQLADWPRTAEWMLELAATTARAIQTGQPIAPPELPHTALLLRNAAFTLAITAHGLRRLLPPY